jgi:hypothetical protein
MHGDHWHGYGSRDHVQIQIPRGEQLYEANQILTEAQQIVTHASSMDHTDLQKYSMGGCGSSRLVH